MARDTTVSGHPFRKDTVNNEQLKYILDRTPNKVQPEEAVRDLMVSWLVGISKATIEEGKALSREQASMLLDVIRDDSLQLADAMLARRIDQYKNSPYN
jgi:hypothetical protein